MIFLYEPIDERRLFDMSSRLLTEVKQANDMRVDESFQDNNAVSSASATSHSLLRSSSAMATSASRTLASAVSSRLRKDPVEKHQKNLRTSNADADVRAGAEPITPEKSITITRTARTLDLAGAFCFVILRFLSSTLSVIEVVLVAYHPTGRVLHAQIAILSFSMCVWLIDVISSLCCCTLGSDVPLLQKVRDTIDLPCALDFVLMLFGWGFLFKYPGVAALRCFRIFRVIGYVADESWSKHVGGGTESMNTHVRGDPNGVDSASSDIVEKGYKFISIRFLARLWCQHLNKIWQEFCTGRSHGFLVIVGLIFFLTYIFAIIFWKDKGYVMTSDGQSCSSLSTCYLTLLRLIFCDSIGFNYLTALAQEDVSSYDDPYGSYSEYTYNSSIIRSYQRNGEGLGFAVLLVLYFVTCSAVLLNGIIGIMGDTFLPDANESFGDSVGNSRGSMRGGGGPVTKEGEKAGAVVLCGSPPF